MNYNISMILGIDEVGRGPWAGPLVVGAVVLGGVGIDGLTDSKKLTKKRREELNETILAHAAGVGLGWVSASEIDEIGLSASLRLATRRAVEQINAPYHEIIIDGTINFLAETSKGQYVTTMKKADLLVPSVSAASIVAKVARDAFMSEQETIYPGYHFKSHVGYGTAAHRVAIEKLGVTPLHRLSFAPLAKYRDRTRSAAESISPDVTSLRSSTTRVIGNLGESIACDYLRAHGHEIIARNWRTKFCEIDIITKKANVLFFVEAKHRRSDQQGGGIAAITPTKLKQMAFAAELFVTRHHMSKLARQLAVITTTGDSPTVDSYLELS